MQPVRANLRSGVIRLILVGVSAAALLPAPWILESFIASELDYRALRAGFARVFHERTGLYVTIQGVHFDIFRGLVFNGTKFYQENAGQERVYLAQAESLVLRYSVWERLRGRPPVTALSLRGGRIFREGPGFGEYWRLMQRLARDAPEAPATAPEAPGARAQSDSLPIERQPEESARQAASALLPPRLAFSAEDLRFNLSDIDLTLRERLSVDALSLDLEATPEGDAYRLKLDLRALREERAVGRLQGRGELRADGRSRLLFEVEGLPLRLLGALFPESPVAPIAIASNASGVYVASGEVAGSGSVESYGDGAGFNFDGAYENLSVALGDPDLRLVSIEEGSGRVYLNGGFEPARPESGYILLRVNQPGFALEVERRNIGAPAGLPTRGRNAPAAPPRTLEVKGEFEFGETPDLPRFAGLESGRAKLQLRSESGRETRPFVQLELADWKFALPQALESETLEPEFFLTRCRIASRTPGGPLDAELSGTLLGGQLRLKGEIDLAMRPLVDPVAEYTLVQNYRLAGELDGAKYEDLGELAYRIGESILREGSGDQSRKAEDLGPLWQNKFFETGLYRTYLENLKFNLSLNVLRHGLEGRLPAPVQLNASMQSGYVRAELEPNRSETGELAFKYTANFLSFIPRQEIEFKLLLRESGLRSARFLGANAPLGDAEVSYAYAGDGVFPGDLVQRSFSRLSINLARPTLGAGRIYDLIRHDAGLDQSETALDALSLTRTTDGPKAQLAVRAIGAGNRFDFSGTGEGVIGIGGEMELRFADRRAAAERRATLRFRQLPDGEWAPRI